MLIAGLKKRDGKQGTGGAEMKVFLGGTCNNSDWREKLIKDLKIDYYNPVVEDWTSECMEEEIRQRKECDICLYVISKEMTGVYSIAEAIDDSNKRPERTVFSFIEEGFSDGQIESLEQVGSMVSRNGGYFVYFGAVVTLLNTWKLPE